MTSQELALRQGVPPELAAAGVQIEESGGYRALIFPPEIKQRFNVLLATSEVAQANPHYTPSVRAVQLDAVRDTYHDSNSRDGERSPNKIGLLKLASAASLGFPQTRRMSRDQLADNEIGWQATLTVRRSDGTEQAITASKVVNVDLEREKVKQSSKDEAAFRRRWTFEREHIDAKAETKAIERAIRMALQLPHAFTDKELAKPFLVVSYSFTPDWSDPETKRLLIGRGLGAQSQLYGNGGGAAALPAGTPVEAPADSQPVSGTDAAAGQQAGAAPPAPSPEGGVPAAPAPDFTGDEPTAATPDDPAAAAGQVRLTFGRYSGLTIDDIARVGKNDGPDPGYVTWLANQMDAKTDNARTVKDAARAYAAAYLAGAQ